jgi:hypothetical protein
MSKRELPPCSVACCKRTAGAIIANTLYCGQHALKKFQERSRKDAPCTGSTVHGQTDQLLPG